jgi:two-component system, chemotaxis family, chemotaxis protein CheY
MARVTVVNDTPDFLDLVHDILEGDRYETTLIDGDRDDAFELVRGSRPDLLMIDLRLGGEGLSGWEIAQRVRAEPDFDGLPVIVCSADLQAMSELESDLADTGTRRVATLTKPFEIQELTDTIDRLLSEAGSG